jgi:hypothetical protein
MPEKAKEGLQLTVVYACPICKRNKSKFFMIIKLAQEVMHDADTGELIYMSDEMETLTLSDGRPDLDLRCAICGHVGPLASFVPN